MTQRDWKKELLIPGEAFGKEYKTKSGLKAFCYGDKRMGSKKYNLDYPLLFKIETVNETGTKFEFSNYTETGLLTQDRVSTFDIDGIWEEPKPKIKTAFFTYQGETGTYFSNKAYTKEYAEEFCKSRYYQLIDWPAKLDRVFEEDAL